jgi:hypothetical protein
MCVIKRVLESNDVVPGGGAVRCFPTPYLRAPLHEAWLFLLIFSRLIFTVTRPDLVQQVEAALSIYLENFATTLSSREQVSAVPMQSCAQGSRMLTDASFRP